MNPTVTLVETLDELNEFWRWLDQRRPILGLDTETTGLEWWTPNFLRTTQFGDAEQAWVLPQEWWGKAVKDGIENYDRPIVGQNIKFEMHALASAGIKLPTDKLEDTQFLAWLAAPDKRQGLKATAEKLVDPRAGFPEYMLGKYFTANGWNRTTGWAATPVDAMPYWFYGGWDPILTARVYETLKAHRGPAYELEMALLPIVCRMEQAGMAIDYPLVDETRQAWALEMADLKMRCKEYGLNNPGSNPQIEAALKGEGWVPEEFTKTGQAKLDKTILAGIPHELGDLIIQYKRLQKWDSTYLKKFQRLEDNGRVHGNIKQCEARTGRMSVTDPPLQTIPRGAEIRRFFLPGEGQSLVTIDYAQIELRLLAHYSGDKRMIEQFNEGHSLHKLLATKLWGESYDLEQYTITKNTWFSKAYGAGIDTFASTAGITVEQAQSIYDGLDEEYPGIQDLMDYVVDVGKTRAREEGQGYIRLLDGTVLPADPGEEYALVDYLLQGTAAKILKQAAVNMANAGLDEFMRMFVHDEVVFEVPTEHAEEIMTEAQEIMNDTDNYAVPIIAEGDLCPTSWGSKYA